jgi:acyl-CoA thioester hydrolase
MPRLDPALLDAAHYPYCATIPTRFRDLDVNGHINNVAMVGLLEEGRVGFHGAAGYHAAMAEAKVGAMVARNAIDYLAEAHYPAPIDIHCGAAELGRSSYQLVQLVTQGGRPVAFARAVMVCTGAGGSVPIPEAFRASVQPFMLRA